MFQESDDEEQMSQFHPNSSAAGEKFNIVTQPVIHNVHLSILAEKNRKYKQKNKKL